MFEIKIFNNIEISFSILAFDLKIKEAIFLPIYIALYMHIWPWPLISKFIWIFFSKVNEHLKQGKRYWTIQISSTPHLKQNSNKQKLKTDSNQYGGSPKFAKAKNNDNAERIRKVSVLPFKEVWN